MLGIPGPARVAVAAANFHDAAVRGGLADLRPHAWSWRPLPAATSAC